MRDKPSLAMVRTLNDIADLLTAVREAGLDPADGARAVMSGVASAGRFRYSVNADRSASEDWDWIDGVWSPPDARD